jgi:uncharacterized protein YjbJ (UPF0337 family)
MKYNRIEGQARENVYFVDVTWGKVTDDSESVVSIDIIVHRRLEPA